MERSWDYTTVKLSLYPGIRISILSLKKLGITGEFYQKAGPNTGPEA